METEQLSYDYLFERHPEEQIRRWINNLEYSYYIRAWGGHANDGDHFVLKLRFGNRKELLHILKKLGIKLKPIPEERPEPVSRTSRTSHTSDGWSTLKSPIHDFPEYEQPGHIKIGEMPCFCWIENGTVDFTFSGHDGDQYEVSDANFLNCLKFEKLIQSNGLADKVSRTVESSVTCISRRKYPHLFD